MKFLLILAFVSLSQVCKGESLKDFSVNMTLSHLKNDLDLLTPGSDYTSCFNETLRVPFYYGVKNFSANIKELSKEIKGNGTNYLDKISTEMDSYPWKMAGLIDKGQLQDAKDYMNQVEDTVLSFMTGFIAQINNHSAENSELKEKFDAFYQKLESIITALVTKFKNCTSKIST